MRTAPLLKSARLLPSLLVLLPLQGCKVPDIKPFSAATVEMTSAVAAGFDQVLSDLSATTSLDLDDAQLAVLRQQRQAFAQQAAANQQVLAAFDRYAGTLVEVSEAGDKGKASLDKIAGALSGVAAALSPAGAVVGPVVARGVQEISGHVQTIRTLGKLEAAMQPADAAIQSAANALKANLLDLARIDSAAAGIVDAQLRGANQNVLQAYADLRIRQDRADSLTSLLVLFENDAVKFKRATGDRRRRYQLSLTEQLASLALADEELTELLPFNPARLRETLAALGRREAYWRQRAENGISPAMQARYDRVQAALLRNQANLAQQRSILRKCGALVGAWAAGHASLKKAVTDRRRTVSFQELIEGARQLRSFLDRLPAPTPLATK